MADDEWGELGVSGDRVNPRDILNHLLIVWVVEYVAHSPTKFTRPDKPSDVIVVDVCDLDLPDVDGYQGLLSRRVWWRQARLIGLLREKIGQRMLCKMTQGVASAGFNAPFQLVNMKADPEARARGEAWLNSHTNFVPSDPLKGPVPAGSAGTSTSGATVTLDPVVDPQKTMLERMAEQAERGAARLPPPPPPPPGIPF